MHARRDRCKGHFVHCRESKASYCSGNESSRFLIKQFWHAIHCLFNYLEQLERFEDVS